MKINEFDCSMDWMHAICYFRGTIKEYVESSRIQHIIKKIGDADIVITPIADIQVSHRETCAPDSVCASRQISFPNPCASFLSSVGDWTPTELSLL